MCITYCTLVYLYICITFVFVNTPYLYYVEGEERERGRRRAQQAGGAGIVLIIVNMINCSSYLSDNKTYTNDHKPPSGAPAADLRPLGNWLIETGLPLRVS